MRVDHANLTQPRAQGVVVDGVPGGHEHPRGTSPRQLVQGQQLAFVGFICGIQVPGLRRQVPQLQALMAAAQGARQRVLRRVIEHHQPQPPGEPQATSLTLR